MALVAALHRSAMAIGVNRRYHNIHGDWVNRRYHNIHGDWVNRRYHNIRGLGTIRGRLRRLRLATCWPWF